MRPLDGVVRAKPADGAMDGALAALAPTGDKLVDGHDQLKVDGQAAGYMGERQLRKGVNARVPQVSGGACRSHPAQRVHDPLHGETVRIQGHNGRHSAHRDSPGRGLLSEIRRRAEQPWSHRPIAVLVVDGAQPNDRVAVRLGFLGHGGAHSPPEGQSARQGTIVGRNLEVRDQTIRDLVPRELLLVHLNTMQADLPHQPKNSAKVCGWKGFCPLRRATCRNYQADGPIGHGHGRR